LFIQKRKIIFLFFWLSDPLITMRIYTFVTKDLSINFTLKIVFRCKSRVHVLLIHEKTKLKNLIIQYMQFWLIILFNIMCGPRVGKCVAILAISTPNTWECLFKWGEKRSIILMYSSYFKWVVYLWNPICLEKLCSLSTYIKFIFKLCILMLDCSYK